MWIESHQSLARHWKTQALVDLLDVELVAAIGYLQMLWWWCLEYADDGDLSRFAPKIIAAAANWKGDASVFILALVEAGFLDAENDRLAVHDWEDYTGKLIVRRRSNAARMRKTRAEQLRRIDAESATSVQPRAAQVQSDQTRPDQTGPDQTGPSGADAQPAKVIPIGRGKRKTTTPASFDLEDVHYDLGEQLGFTTQETIDETARFLDWHRAKGSSLVDWDSAWRNWMRKAKDIRGDRRPARRSAEDYAAAFDRLMDAAALAAAVEPPR